MAIKPQGAKKYVLLHVTRIMRQVLSVNNAAHSRHIAASAAYSRQVSCVLVLVVCTPLSFLFIFPEWLVQSCIAI